MNVGTSDLFSSILNEFHTRSTVIDPSFFTNVITSPNPPSGQGYVGSDLSGPPYILPQNVFTVSISSDPLSVGPVTFPTPSEQLTLRFDGLSVQTTVDSLTMTGESLAFILPLDYEEEVDSALWSYLYFRPVYYTPTVRSAPYLYTVQGSSDCVVSSQQVSYPAEVNILGPYTEFSYSVNTEFEELSCKLHRLSTDPPFSGSVPLTGVPTPGLNTVSGRIIFLHGRDNITSLSI